MLKAAWIAKPDPAERAALAAALQAYWIKEFNAGLLRASAKNLLGPGGTLVECMSPVRVRASQLWTVGSFEDVKVKGAADLLQSMEFSLMAGRDKNPVNALSQ